MPSYRPVSGLPYLGKITEKAAVLQLGNHMETNDLNNPVQSAYRTGHSNETALVKIMNDLLLAIDNKKCVLLVMLDLSAAFDTVEHSILFDRLENMFGVTDDAKLWLKSYFSQRKQCVNINGTFSDPKPLNVGMPQGSVLGPFCFPPYTSPLYSIAKENNCEIHMYADDTQLYISFNQLDGHKAMETLEQCIKKIRAWMKTNCLKLNDSKTEFLIVNQKGCKSVFNESISIGDDKIAPSTSAKNIGAMIDSYITMESQVKEICRKCYLSLYQISQIRSYITDDAACTLVNALVTSKLDNLNSLLYGLPDCKIQQLQYIQNNAARLIAKCKKYDNITPILKKLHWLPVSFRIQYKILLLCFKSLNGLGPKYLAELLLPYVPDKDLRSSDEKLLIEPKTRLKTYGDRAFSICAPRLWNKLPKALRLSTKIEAFKKHLKTHLFKQAFDHC